MSAIFGLVRFDGRPVLREDLERMAEPLRHWGTERALWHDTHAGLGMLVDLRTPNPAIAPTIFADGAVVVAIGRLDNADELARELDLDAATPDGAIMAAAWQRWRAESPRHLHGDWSFAAWSPALAGSFSPAIPSATPRCPITTTPASSPSRAPRARSSPPACRAA